MAPFQLINGEGYVGADVATLAGPSETGSTPADPTVAAGPTSLVMAVNSSVEFVQKSGYGATTQAMSTFFASLVPNGELTDPRVTYDAWANHFVLSELDQNGSSSRVLLAVSSTSDPTAGWFFEALSAAETVNGQPSYWDFDGLSVDQTAIYVTGNLYGDSGGPYVASRVWVVDKTAIYAGNTSGPAYEYDPMALAGAPEIIIQPTNYRTDPGNLGAIFASFEYTGQGTDDYLNIVQLINPLSGSPTVIGHQIDVGPVTYSSNLPYASQPGFSGKNAVLSTGDPRLESSLIFSNGELYTSLTTLPSTGPDAWTLTAHWIEINTASWGVTLQGDVNGQDVAAGAYTFYPALDVDAYGNIAMSFALAAPTVNVGAYYAVIPAGTTSPEATGVLMPGAAAFDDGTHRWGDYSAMVADPDGLKFWSFNMYPTTATQWSTAVGAFSQVAEPFYRLYNVQFGTHYYTSSETEWHSLRALAFGTSAGWLDESYSGADWSLATSSFNGGLAVQGVYDPNLPGYHYYTLSTYEVASLVSQGWQSNPLLVPGYMWTTNVPGTVEVYYIYNSISGQRIWTTSAAERAQILTETYAGAGWVAQADLGWALPSILADM